MGLQDDSLLGNLDAKRDWGFAGDYVEAMWLMTQQKTPDDYVVATGETHTVREFLQVVFDYAGLDIDKYVEIDERLLDPRPLMRFHSYLVMPLKQKKSLDGSQR